MTLAAWVLAGCALLALALAWSCVRGWGEALDGWAAADRALEEAEKLLEEAEKREARRWLSELARRAQRPEGAAQG